MATEHMYSYSSCSCIHALAGIALEGKADTATPMRAALTDLTAEDHNLHLTDAYLPASSL